MSIDLTAHVLVGIKASECLISDELKSRLLDESIGDLIYVTQNMMRDSEEYIGIPLYLDNAKNPKDVATELTIDLICETIDKARAQLNSIGVPPSVDVKIYALVAIC